MKIYHQQCVLYAYKLNSGALGPAPVESAVNQAYYEKNNSYETLRLPEQGVIEYLVDFHRQHTDGQLSVSLTGMDEPNTFYNRYAEHFTIVPAAGGIVRNPEGEVLLIHRRNMWDLPKGKIDAGEAPEAAAEREIQEETGLKTLEYIERLPDTYHIFHDRTDGWILKPTHWFHFHHRLKEPLAPQTEEEIDDARWVPAEMLQEYYQLTYASLEELFIAFQHKYPR